MDTAAVIPGTASVPKVIGPRAHAALDYVTAAAFLVAGLALRSRQPRAAAAALVNGGAVLVVSMCTDYPGGVFRRLTFRQHGRLDTAQAALCAVSPVLFGFTGTPDAQAFYAQAGVEAGIVAATDFPAIP